nr:MAG: internal scaffolding protein [Microvirus sp.]
MKKIITENGRVRVVTVNDKPSKTQQQFKDSCDMEKIMSNYRKTGQLPPSGRRGVYLDTTILPQDYQSALNIIIEAETVFESLPSETRKRFQNDPKKLLEFVSDPKNHEEAKQLGLKEDTVQTDPVPKAKSAQQQKAKKDQVKQDINPSDNE